MKSGTNTDDPRQHPLFQRFELAALAQTSRGMLPVPYHIYDGHALFIGGMATLEPVRDLLAAESVHAVETTDGHALMGVWVIDAPNASLGAHQELQFSILVSRHPVPKVPSDPFIISRLLQFDPTVRVLCHGLWNDTEPVVAYNREILALDARMMVGEIVRDQERRQKRFAFTDAAGSPIFSGMVHEAKRTGMSAILPLLRSLGMRRFLQAAAAPWLMSQVVNPIGLRPLNAEAQAYIVNGQQVLQTFDPATDHVEFAHPIYRALEFRGQFIQHMNAFKFVYLNMHNAGIRSYSLS
jgi:hypothetical protein